MDDLVYQLIDKFFEGFSFKKYEDEIFSIYNNDFCISFFISDDSIGITQLNRCGFSGTNNLERLELLASACSITNIKLDDQSSVPWNKLKINFAMITILSKGQSWYNSLGYYQEHYIEESNNWNILRHKNIKDCFEDLNLISYYEYFESSEYDNYYDDAIDLYINLMNIEDISDNNFGDILLNSLIVISNNCPELDIENNDIKTVCSIIYLNIKSGKELEYNKQVLYYLYPSLCFLLVQYTRDPLIKKLT